MAGLAKPVVYHLTEINEVANVIPLKRYTVYTFFYTLIQSLKVNLGSEER